MHRLLHQGGGLLHLERLKYATDQKITFANAFEIADDVLRQAVVSISDLINIPGIINLDFADVTSIMKDAGYAHMGLGAATYFVVHLIQTKRLGKIPLAQALKNME